LTLAKIQKLMFVLALAPWAGVAGASASPVQGGVFSFQSYGQESGLRNLSIYAVAQDVEGFLWAGTEDGLYRYDGRHFQQMGKGLKSTTIWNVTLTPKGRPWVETDEGLFCLEGEAFKPVPGTPSRRPDFVHRSSGGEGLVVYGPQVLESIKGTNGWQVVKNLEESITTGWASDDQGTVLLCGEARLWRFEKGVWASTGWPGTSGVTRGRILQDSKGRIWFRTRFGLYRMERWGKPWVDLTRLLPGNAFNVNAPVEDALGRIWFGTSKGLLCVEGDDSWVLNEAKGLPGGWATVVFVDREGSLWVGSEGLQRLQGRFLWTGFGPHQGLPSPSVWDIDRAMDGRMYACTDHGVAVLEGERWKVLPGTAGKTIFSAGEDGQGGLWFGVANRDRSFAEVSRLDLSNHRLEAVSLEPCKASSVLLTIAPDRMGGIFAGTIDQGVFHVIRDGRHWKTEAVPFPEMKSRARVNNLLMDTQGHLWAASEHGLYVLDGGAWQHLEARHGLLGSNCNSLAMDGHGNVWVAFVDARGINRMGRDRDGWKAIEAMTAPEGLFEEPISSMAFDVSNVLWLGTGAGMKRWDGSRLETFGKGEGLPGMDPSANGIFPDTDGGIWQGFSNGVGHYNPRAFRGSPGPPSATILAGEDATHPLLLDPALPRPRIPYRDRTVTFQFSTLSFLNESRVVHQVRLVGLEDEWRETRINEARYPALPAGSYSFEVRSRFVDGAPGPIAKVSFQILPPWWGTWWFWTLAPSLRPEPCPGEHGESAHRRAGKLQGRPGEGQSCIGGGQPCPGGSNPCRPPHGPPQPAIP
jgi:ligand-binding sensor domain-containing protein